MSRQAGLAPFLGVLLLIAAQSWAADEDSKPEPPALETRSRQLPWATVTQVVLPGRALDVAPWPGEGNPGETGGLAVLLRDETAAEGPRLLYRLRGSDSDLAPVFTGLPTKAGHLHERAGELWVGEPGKIHRYRMDRRLELVLAAEGLNLGTLVQRGLVDDERLIVPEVGRLRQYVGAELALASDIALPIQARRRARRLELWSPGVRRMPGEELLLVTSPEATDTYRMRVLMIPGEAPPADEAEEDAPPWQESWSRFDGPETLNQRRFTRLDGHPALIVTTTRADKLGIFEKLKVRVFILRPDRTRAGRRPVASFETATRNWYDLEPRVTDFNGDGKDDLLLIQPEGLGAGELKIELYAGRGSGRFDTRSRATKLDGEAASWDMSADFTGDGTPDLLLVAEQQLSIHPALPNHRRQVVSKKPLHQLALAEWDEGSVEITINLGTEGSDSETLGLATRPRLLQLDEDAAPEIVLISSAAGRAVIRIVDLL